MPRLPRRLPPLLALAALLSACDADAPAADGGPFTPLGVMEEACPECRLEATTLARIGTAEGDGALPHGPGGFARDARGRYWLTFANSALPMVFDSSGAFLGRVGAQGSGPGELRYPGHTAAVGDSVLVLDAMNGGLVFGPDMAWVRTVSVPGGQVSDAAVLDWPGRVMTAGFLMRHVPRALVLDLGGEEGVAVDSLVLGDPVEPGGHVEGGVVVTAAGDGGGWATRNIVYRLVEWQAEGAAGREIAPEVSWLTPGTNGLPGGPRHEPNPVISDLTTDAAGRIWVVGRVARADWAKVWERYPPIPPAAGEVSASAFPMPHELYHTVIDVWDPATGALLVSRRFDAFVDEVLEDGSFAVYRESDTGVPEVEIIRVTLSDPGGA